MAVFRKKKRRVSVGKRHGRNSWKYLSPGDLKQFKNLLFAAKTIVEGAYSGRHKSPFKGSAPEFVDYREYYPGDEIRTIDWKAYARTDRYFIKLFEKETDMNCYLLVDRSASMNFGGKEYIKHFGKNDVSKMDYAFHLAAALIYLMVQQGDKTSLTLFDEKVNLHVPPGGTFPHLYKVLNLLERQLPGSQTSISRVLREAFPLYKRKGLLIVISDFLDDPEEIFKSLNMYRHRNFEIILFHVMHKFEYELPPLHNINFIDSENGAKITAKPADIRNSYDGQIQDFIATMRRLSFARKIDYNFINTSVPYSAILQKYLLKRNSS